MPFLVAQIDAAPVDLRRWAAVLPLVITRLRDLSFDSDGVVRFPGGRREGLRLVDGRAGRSGATYRVVLPDTVVDPVTLQETSRPADPVELTVEFLEIVSLMLKAVVFYLIGVGLWSLFVAPLNITVSLGVRTLSDLEAKVAALTEENARLKGLKGRPTLKPSGMEKGTDPSPAASGRVGRRQRRREPRPPESARLIVDEDRVVPLAPQPGWRFKGFKFYTVQDLVVETCATGGRATGRRRVS